MSEPDRRRPVQIGQGGSGNDATPECPVCYARGGGGHGGLCPNAGKPPEQWTPEPPPGWRRPLRHPR